MRIAIDCRWISRDTGGIRRYMLNILDCLSKIDKTNDYVLIFDKHDAEILIKEKTGDAANFKLIKVSYGPFSLSSQLFLPGVLKTEKIDVFYSTNFMAPIFFNKYKVIVTIHDLIPYLHPEWCHRSIKSRIFLVFKILMNSAVRAADRIVTDSNHSRDDIVRSFPFSKDKVNVIYIGAERKFYPIKENSLIEGIKNKYGLKNCNILYVGRQDPSKNIMGLIRAFNVLRKEKGLDCCLVIAGKKDKRYPEPYEFAEKSGLKKDIVFTGNIEDRELVLLYNAADLFVFPSLYEGFGLPPLEAMACGVPVVTSNTSSLPEVVGDAGIMINPDNIEEIAEAMYKVLTDRKLKKDLIEKGLKRSKMFCWEKAAGELLTIMEEK